MLLRLLDVELSLPTVYAMTEPLQPGDPDEAEQGAPPPVPDPPDTDPIPEEESEP